VRDNRKGALPESSKDVIESDESRMDTEEEQERSRIPWRP